MVYSPVSERTTVLNTGRVFLTRTLSEASNRAVRARLVRSYQGLSEAGAGVAGADDDRIGGDIAEALVAIGNEDDDDAEEVEEG